VTEVEPVALERIDRTRVKDQALAQLKRYIVSGAVAKGHRLPSERELARALGVGRNSVREALKVLEALGVVESRIGEGTFIVDQTGTQIGRALGLSIATWSASLAEILEARQMIEVAAAGEAAIRRDDRDLRDLQVQLDAMEQAVNAPYDYLAADMTFHRIVARATHNTVVLGIVANLVDLVEEFLRDAHVDAVVTLIEGKGTHRAIFDAIEQALPSHASSAMRKHLQLPTEIWATVTSLGGAESAPQSTFLMPQATVEP
jgi:GntR family transcriptional repressor for pyruvate dehydrogenase complex